MWCVPLLAAKPMRGKSRPRPPAPRIVRCIDLQESIESATTFGLRKDAIPNAFVRAVNEAVVGIGAAARAVAQAAGARQGADERGFEEETMAARLACE